MKKGLLFLLILMGLMPSIADASNMDFGLVTTADILRLPLSTLDSAGIEQRPDSFHVMIWFEGEATANSASYTNRITTSGAEDLTVDSLLLGGVNYWYWFDAVADVDNGEGEGNYSGNVITWNHTTSAAIPTFNTFSFILYDDESESVLDEIVAAGTAIALVVDTVNGIMDTLQLQDGWVAKEASLFDGDLSALATAASLVLAIDSINAILDTLQLYDGRYALAASLTLVIDTVNGIIDTLQNQDNWIAQEATLAYFDTLIYIGPRGLGIYLDSSAANTNTVIGTDGTAKNPVSTLVAARTLSDALGVKRYYLINRSTFASAATDFSAEHADFEIIGVGHLNRISFGNQVFTGATFINLNLGGVLNGSSGHALYQQVEFDTLTTSFSGHVENSWLVDTIIIKTGQRNVAFTNCQSGVAGNMTPTLDMAGASSTTASIRGYSGGIRIMNGGANDTISIETDGQVIISANNNVGLVVTLRGMLTLADSTAGITNLTKDAVFSRSDDNTWANAVDLIWDEDSTGHYTSPHMAFLASQTGASATDTSNIKTMLVNNWTSASSGLGWANMLADTTWEEDSTGHYTSPNMAFLASQTGASSIDSTVVSNIMHRVVYGLPVGSGSDSTTLAQRKVNVHAIKDDEASADSLSKGLDGYDNAQLTNREHLLTNLDEVLSTRSKIGDTASVWGSSKDATLKSLVVSNSAGDAVQFTSTGGNGDGFQVLGNGTGFGMLTTTGFSIRNSNGTAFIMGSDGSDGHGLHIFGNGLGEGINITGGNRYAGTGVQVKAGDSGIAVHFAAANDSGAVTFWVENTTEAGHAVQFASSGGGSGLDIEGQPGINTRGFENTGAAGMIISGDAGSGGRGLAIQGFGPGEGLYVTSDDSTGPGGGGSGGGSGDAVRFLTLNNQTGEGFSVTSIASHAVQITGGGTGDGVNIRSGSGATGDGIDVAAASTNGIGVRFEGTGSQPGMTTTGGSSSGHGLLIQGQGTGHGLTILSGSGATGDGVFIQSQSTNGHGMSVEGGGTGDGLHLTAAGSGIDLNAPDLVDLIWDEDTTGHYVVSKYGLEATTGSISQANMQEIADSVDADLTADHGSGAWTSSAGGSGSETVTVLAVDTIAGPGGAKVLLQDVKVTILNAASSQIGTQFTNGSGSTSWSLDAEAHTLKGRRTGFIFPNHAITVAGTQTDTILGYGIVIPTPGNADLATVFGYLKDAQDVNIVGAIVTAVRIGANAVDTTGTDVIVPALPVSEPSDSTGYFALTLRRTKIFPDTAKGFYNISGISADGTLLFNIPRVWIPGSGNLNLGTELATRP